MPDTPLNPDALEAASRAIDPEAWEVVDKHRGDPGAERLCASLTSEVTAQVSAYLAVAQPEVNSVEELDALPVGTVIQSGGYPEEKDFGLYRKFAEESWLFSEDSTFRGLSIGLPARVLYRPTEEPRNGR